MFLKVPALQGIRSHLTLPSTDVSPVAHGSQGTVRFLSLEKEFFWQGLHLSAPAISLNSPGMHGKQEP